MPAALWPASWASAAVGERGEGAGRREESTPLPNFRGGGPQGGVRRPWPWRAGGGHGQREQGWPRASARGEREREGGPWLEQGGGGAGRPREAGAAGGAGSRRRRCCAEEEGVWHWRLLWSWRSDAGAFL